MKQLFGLIAVLLVGSVVYAQDHPSEVGLNYSYLRFLPSGNSGGHSFNGGGGDVTWFLNSAFGIKAEFEGYGSTQYSFTNGTTTFRNNQANLFTYNFGPVVKVRLSRWEPFGEVLTGGAHSNFYRNLCVQTTCTTTSPSNDAWDFIVGGGVDFRVGSHWEVRPIEVDYVLTRFGNAFSGGNQNQNNVRYLGGARFRF